MQSGQFEPPRRAESLDREFVRDDDEFAVDGYEASEGEPDRRWLRPLWVLLGMALLGVVLALIWHNVKPTLWFASLSTQTTNSPGSAGTNSRP